MDSNSIIENVTSQIHDIKSRVNEYSNLLEEYNKDHDDYNIDVDINDIIKDIRLDNTDLPQYMQKIMTPNKMMREIVNYELINYDPKDKLDFKEMSTEDIIKIMLDKLNRFNILIGNNITEDNEWIINNSSNILLKTKENTIAFINTVKYLEIDNPILEKHCKLLERYFKRLFKNIRIKLDLIEANEYNFHWFVVIIKPFNKLSDDNIKSVKPLSDN